MRSSVRRRPGSDKHCHSSVSPAADFSPSSPFPLAVFSRAVSSKMSKRRSRLEPFDVRQRKTSQISIALGLFVWVTHRGEPFVSVAHVCRGTIHCNVPSSFGHGCNKYIWAYSTLPVQCTADKSRLSIKGLL